MESKTSAFHFARLVHKTVKYTLADGKEMTGYGKQVFGNILVVQDGERSFFLNLDQVISFEILEGEDQES